MRVDMLRLSKLESAEVRFRVIYDARLVTIVLASMGTLTVWGLRVRGDRRPERYVCQEVN